MKSIQRRINDIKKNLSGFRDEKDRLDAIRYLRSLDPDIDPASIQTFKDFENEVKSFFAPLPNSEAWDNWLGTEQHEKYMRRQKAKLEKAN